MDRCACVVKEELEDAERLEAGKQTRKRRQVGGRAKKLSSAKTVLGINTSSGSDGIVICGNI
jgi:hypothetical protein